MRLSLVRVGKVLFTLFLIFASFRIDASDSVTHAVVAADPWFYLGKLGFALVTVILFFLLFAWVTRRYQNMGQTSNKGLAVVGSLSLGTRERLVVVQAGNRQVLLGITSTQINSLLELDAPLEQPTEATQKSFRASLDQLLGKDAGKV